MENSETNYLGNAKTYGSRIQVSLNWEDLKSCKKTEFQGKKYLIIDLFQLKQISKFGNTHSVVEHIHIPKEESQTK